MTGSPDIGRQRTTQQEAAKQHDPAGGMAGGRRAAGSRDSDGRPSGIADVELAGPVRAGDERGSRLWPARGRVSAPAMEVEGRGLLRAVTPRIEVEIDPRGLG